MNEERDLHHPEVETIPVIRYCGDGKIGELKIINSAVTDNDLEEYGLMRCDGSNLHCDEFFELFDVVGHKYGGEGHVFKVPDAEAAYDELRDH